MLIDLTDIRGEVCYVPLDFDPLEMYRTGTLLTEEEFEVILKRETYDFDTELSYAKRSIIDALGHTSLTDSQVDELKIIIQEWLGDLMAKGEIKGFDLGIPDPLEDTDVDLIIGGSPPPTAKDFALTSYAIQYHKINGRFPSAQEYQMAETMCADIWTFFNKRLRPISGI